MERVGRYEILRRLDSGGSGAAYLASDPDSMSEIILRVASPRRYGAAEELHRFAEETARRTEAAARLQHPAIVPVKKIVLEVGLVWAAIDFPEGRTLAELLSEPGRCDKRQILRALRQTAECLDYAHEHGVFHGSLKPADIVVRPNGSAVLIGFGLTDVAPRDDSIAGKRPFQPDGRSSGSARDGKAADQIALAVIAQEVLTGRPLGSGLAGNDRDNARHSGLPRIEQLTRALSEDVAGVFARVLTPERHDRYQDCREFVSALESVLEVLPDWNIAIRPMARSTPEGQAAALSPLLTGDFVVGDLEELAENRRGFLRPLRRASANAVRRPAFLVAFAVFTAALLSVLYLGVDTRFGSRGEALGEPAGLLPEAVVGAPYSHPLFAEDAGPPGLWEIAGGSVPPGLALDHETGAIRGTPESPGHYRWTLRRRNGDSEKPGRSFMINILRPFGIANSSPLPRGTTELFYTHALSAAGGSDPRDWTVVRGELPPGLALDRETGVIAGTPASAGSFEFSVRATDASNSTATADFRLVIRSKSSTAGAADLLADRHGPAERTAGPGASGLKFDETAEAGAGGSQPATRDGPPRLAVASHSALPPVAPGSDFSTSISVNGGIPPYRFALGAGSLPPGLELDSARGRIFGTPRQVGDFRSEIVVTDAAGSSSTGLFRLSVESRLSVTTTSPLPAGQAQRDYSQRLAVANGIAPLSWSVAAGSLPPGVDLDSAGVLRGVPAEAGEYGFTIQVSDAAGARANRRLSVRVEPQIEMPALSVLPAGKVGEAYSHALRVTGGNPPFEWSAGAGLPGGLTLERSTGVVRGRPTEAGRFRFDVEVRAASGASIQGSSEIQILPAAGGEVSWTGSLDADSVLTIQDGRFASVGALQGELPGRPVRIEIEPPDGLTVVTRPGPENGWKLMVIHTAQPRTRLRIRWFAVE